MSWNKQQQLHRWGRKKNQPDTNKQQQIFLFLRYVATVYVCLPTYGPFVNKKPLDWASGGK
jgi:hypothetical protein